MDLNATTTIVNNNQENNQLLLDAIKNKFAAQTANEAAAFSPPKFNIPLLKIPGGENTNVFNNKTITSQHTNNTPAATQLNNFLLKQLQEKHTNNGEAKEHTGFVLPQLHMAGNNKASMKFELPVLKQPATALPGQHKDTKISSLTTAINKLQVQDSATENNITNIPHTPTIDLTTALACKLLTHQGTPPTRDFVKSSKIKDNEIDFVIPFIDCDRLDKSRKHALLLPISNEYCVTDISKLLLQHSFVEPSAIGRFLSIDDDNKYSPPLPLKCLSKEYRQQRVKHQIVPFRFETMSPDDIVLEALNKYQRRHYN